MKPYELYGAVLCGGYSARMGRDKALLDYGHGPQVQVSYALLQACCEQVFVSCRADQADLFLDYPRILDEYPHSGPMGGVLSVMESASERAWLLLACDLPNVSVDALKHLICERQPSASATAYERGGRLEPLCAIYEPAALPALQAACEGGDFALHRVLSSLDIVRLGLPEANALWNVNTPAEYEACSPQTCDRPPAL